MAEPYDSSDVRLADLAAGGEESTLLVQMEQAASRLPSLRSRASRYSWHDETAGGGTAEPGIDGDGGAQVWRLQPAPLPPLLARPRFALGLRLCRELQTSKLVSPAAAQALRRAVLTEDTSVWTVLEALELDSDAAAATADIVGLAKRFVSQGDHQ